MTLAFTFDADGSSAATLISGFVKIADVPTRPLSIVDIDGGTVGYMRVLWQPPGGGLFGGSMGGLAAEFNYGGSECHTGLAGGAGLSEPGLWYWFSVAFGGWSTGGGGGIHGQMWGPHSITSGPVTATMSPGTPSNSQQVDSNLGWGVNLSGSYDNMPNASGYAMKDLWIVGGDGWQHADIITPVTPPGSDPGALSGLGNLLYLCNQPLGAIPPGGHILDAFNPLSNLVPGPEGATIVADGPY